MKEEELCQCEKVESIYTTNGEWGYWHMCITCEKPTDGEIHYYNEDEIGDLY